MADDFKHFPCHFISFVMPKVVKNILNDSEITTTLTKGGKVVPATEKGFYYDVDLGDTKLGDEDLVKIENEMRKIVKENLPIKPFILPREEAIKLMEEQVAKYKVEHIGDLDEDDTNIKIIGRIMDVQDIHEFTRDDGSVGVVRSIDIGDKTGIIRASLWDSKADMLIEVGDPIKVQNPRIRYDNGLKLNIGSSSNILEPSIKELNEIPSTEELESILFTAKDIGMLEEEEPNVKVHGTLKNIYTDKILIYKCPFCDNTIDKDDKECVVCNNEIVEPKYTLILSGVLEDETDEIEVAFFNNLAEEVIGIKKEDILGCPLFVYQIFSPVSGIMKFASKVQSSALAMAARSL